MTHRSLQAFYCSVKQTVKAATICWVSIQEGIASRNLINPSVGPYFPSACPATSPPPSLRDDPGVFPSEGQSLQHQNCFLHLFPFGAKFNKHLAVQRPKVTSRDVNQRIRFLILPRA